MSSQNCRYNGTSKFGITIIMLQDLKSIIKQKSLTPEQQKSWQEQAILAYLQQQGKNNPHLSFLAKEELEVILRSSSLILQVKNHSNAQILTFYTSIFKDDLSVQIGAPITHITVAIK